MQFRPPLPIDFPHLIAFLALKKKNHILEKLLALTVVVVVAAVVVVVIGVEKNEQLACSIPDPIRMRPRQVLRPTIRPPLGAAAAGAVPAIRADFVVAVHVVVAAAVALVVGVVVAAAEPSALHVAVPTVVAALALQCIVFPPGEGSALRSTGALVSPLCP